jgi:NADH dehydrogenase/NADH:ubiquinone oxidoreductase subunit G
MPAEGGIVQRSGGQLVRAVPRHGPVVRLSVDGEPVEVTEGDSLLAAMLAHGRLLRRLEFDGTPRAGFCLMGACQDCWVWLGEERRVRACTTLVADGMTVWTSLPDERISHG